MEPIIPSPLGRFSEIQLPPTLLPRILSQVHELRLRRLRFQLGWSVTGFVTTAAFTIWNWSVLHGELGGSSPFWGMVRLLKTDPDIVLAFAREFIFGLLESLPIESLVVGLLFLFVALSFAVLLPSLYEQRSGIFRQRHS